MVESRAPISFMTFFFSIGLSLATRSNVRRIYSFSEGGLSSAYKTPVNEDGDAATVDLTPPTPLVGVPDDWYEGVEEYGLCLMYEYGEGVL